MKFDFSKSNNSDLQNKLQLNKFDILNKNILYITHELDRLNKNVLFMMNNSKLQKQVDEYFEDSAQEEEVEKESD